jgi:SulP family sulfate permease
VLPDAIAFALLGAIESLLSAVVADGMTGRRHRSNCELVAQGFANIGSALFGGICVTGTIARTATNVRAGARGPVSGMLHALFLLLFMLIAAPLASYIPLAALAAVLVVVAWNMAEKQEFATLIRSSWGDATVLLATFLLTIFRDLTEGILVGFALGAVLFINRMAQMTGIEAAAPLAIRDRPDGDDREPYDSGLATDPDVLVYRITGAFFFGAASTVGTVLDSIADRRKSFVVDFSAVPFLDSTAANAMGRVATKARRQGIRLFITGASPAVRRALLTHGVSPPRARFRETVARAVADIKGYNAKAAAPEASSPLAEQAR